MDDKPKPFWKLKKVWIPVVVFMCLLIGQKVLNHITTRTTPCRVCTEIACKEGYYSRNSTWCILGGEGAHDAGYYEPDGSGDYTRYLCKSNHSTFALRVRCYLDLALDLLR